MKEWENGNVIENTIRTENDANYVHRDDEILDNHHSEIDSINYKNLYMLYMREWQCEIIFYTVMEIVLSKCGTQLQQKMLIFKDQDLY